MPTKRKYVGTNMTDRKIGMNKNRSHDTIAENNTTDSSAKTRRSWQ